MRLRWLLTIWVGGAVLLASAAHGDVVTDWNDAALRIIQDERVVVAPASRTLAMMHVAIYDAVNNIDGTHEPYRVPVAVPRGASEEAAAAAAAHRVLSALYPQESKVLDTQVASSLAAVPDGPAKEEGIAEGVAVANAILLWRNGDHAAELMAYTPRGTMGSWVPTPPAFTQPLLPQWQEVVPFAMTNCAQFRPGPPPALSSREYAQAVNEVKQIGNRNSATRTPEETAIAQFWADSPGTITTAGRWNQIARQVAARKGYTMVEDARLLAMVNMALADAAVAAWDCKYHYAFWRPVTAIGTADRDGNPWTAVDLDWQPLLLTPSFPEYPSGHSTLSMAAATVLGHEFGDNVGFTVASYDPSAVTRSYTSFSEAAREGGRSRIYGGIHYQFSNLAGRAMGAEIGDYVAAHFCQARPGAEPLPEQRAEKPGNRS